ncbi:MAG: RDD family protein [Elusimicrobia bacterium]|nr:RDD family protein [Elusimicrobiota bacterium]
MDETGTAPLPAAKLTDRFLAFLLDFIPFVCGFYLSLYLLVFKLHRLPNIWPVWQKQLALWTGLWLLYQALGNASGATFGKRLFGLRVEGLDGARLGVARSCLRALGYLVSLPLNLGFLWSLVHPESRAWHDLLAGSRVVEVSPRGQGAALLSAVVSLLVLAGLGAGSLWSVYGRPTPFDLEKVRRAQEGLRILAAIEEAYKAENGRYTNKLADLAVASEDVGAFKQGMAELFDPDGFVLQTGGGGYLIRARALDRRRTPVELAGP